MKERRTVDGSSINSVISACFKKTFPRQTRHNIRSKATIRSRGITPVIKLNDENNVQKMKTKMGRRVKGGHIGRRSAKARKISTIKLD